jgi:hypothetical protein
MDPQLDIRFSGHYNHTVSKTAASEIQGCTASHKTFMRNLS